jgi:predicted small lipoprotein YifL
MSRFKAISLLLVIVLLATLAACGPTEEATQAPVEQPTE